MNEHFLLSKTTFPYLEINGGSKELVSADFLRDPEYSLSLAGNTLYNPSHIVTKKAQIIRSDLLSSLSLCKR